jgi:hypothetical protein
MEAGEPYLHPASDFQSAGTKQGPDREVIPFEEDTATTEYSASISILVSWNVDIS